MATRRHFPYAWASWATKLLAGEARCVWALWFKAHYSFDKVEDPADEARLAQWKHAHNALTFEVGRRFERDGYRVLAEQDCEFKLKGQALILGGRPDVVALRDGSARLVDVKTGVARNSDIAQVETYLYAVPLARKDIAANTWVGEVVYASGPPVPVPAPSREKRGQIAALLRRAGGNVAPPRSPSRSECARCNISGTDCPDRIEPSDAVDATTDEF